MLELIPFTLMVFYLIPWLVACGRGHDMPGVILVANILVGWTIIGWFLVLYVAAQASGESHAPARRDGV